MKFKLLSLLFTVLCSIAYSVNPIRYYTADNVANPPGGLKDEMGNADVTCNGGSFVVVNSGAIGKGIQWTQAADYCGNTSIGSSIITGSFSYEFLWKPDHYIRNGYVGYTNDFSFSAGFDFWPSGYYVPYLSFQTNTGSPNENNTLYAELKGIGRNSLGYYLDGNYHHFVFTYNSATGEKKIYVDGECPAGFSNTTTLGNLNTVGTDHSWYMNTTVSYRKMSMFMDNIALYNVAIDSRQVYQNYLDFMAGNNYSFTLNASSAPTTVITAALNPLDFVSGTSLNAGQTVTPCASCATPLAQLQSYPLPRYWIGAPMLKNLQWFDPTYLAGNGQDGQTVATVAVYVAQQRELYLKWNYYVLAFGNVQPQANYNSVTTNFVHAGVKLCRDNPTWLCQANVFRIQGTDASIYTGLLDSSHYLRNASNQFMNLSGGVDGSKYWSPVSNSMDYKQDGLQMESNLKSLSAALLPNKLKIISENGEYLPVITPSVLALDPIANKARIESGLSPFEYLGKRSYEVSTVGYKNIFMDKSRNPDLNKAWYVQYATDGQSDQNFDMAYRTDYKWLRLLNDQIKGKRYPTGDYYPRVAKNWRSWVAADHGFDWFVYAKNYETTFGDNYISPFVNAGWDKVEENTMRPAQFLGNLKCLSAFGAEFFNSGYFSLSFPFNDPKNWVWQVAMAPYAQAITSRYWDCFSNGDLLDGDVPRNPEANPQRAGYAYYSGDPRKLIIARKHNTKSKYVIAGCLELSDNMIGQAEDEDNATIYLGNDTITFKVRRQGSVYVYDKTKSPAVFYQLDGWHENTHPSRWTADFNFEAENWDNTDDSVRYRTTTGNTGKDYSSYTTTASTIATKYPLRYDFIPRGLANQTYYVWVKAANSTAGTVRLRITLDDLSTQYIDVTGTTLTWYKLKTTGGPVSYPAVTPTKHSLKIYQQTVGMKVDKVSLTTDPAKVFTN